MSDDGSDDNVCRSEFTPCKNLQTVLDRATDGADIYITSPTLSLNKVHRNVSFHFQRTAAHTFAHSVVGLGCVVESRISFKLCSTLHTAVHVLCSGKNLG